MNPSLLSLVLLLLGHAVLLPAFANAQDPEEGDVAPADDDYAAWDPYSADTLEEDEEEDGEKSEATAEEPAVSVDEALEASTKTESDELPAQGPVVEGEFDMGQCAALIAQGNAPPQCGSTKSPFMLSTSLSTDVGQGTFVANEYARNPYVGWSLQLQPSYRFDKYGPFNSGPMLFGRGTLSQELTNSDLDTRNQRVLLADSMIGANHSLFTIPGADVGVMVTARAVLPTSIASQFRTLVMGLQGGLILTRGVGPVSFMYFGSFRKNFHEYTSPVADMSDVDSNVYLARAGGNEQVGSDLFSPGGNNTSYGFTNGLIANWSIGGGFLASASYFILNNFTYNSFPKDELAAEFADAGRGQRDLYQTSVSLMYSLPYLNISAGVSTLATPKAADNSSLRFPFWDFDGAANNFSTIFLSLSTNAWIDGSGVKFQ